MSWGNEAKPSVEYERFSKCVTWFQSWESQICLWREVFRLKINIQRDHNPNAIDVVIEQLVCSIEALTK